MAIHGIEPRNFSKDMTRGIPEPFFDCWANDGRIEKYLDRCEFYSRDQVVNLLKELAIELTERKSVSQLWGEFDYEERLEEFINDHKTTKNA